MRITKLHAYDFLCHEKTEIEPGPVNLVMGPNGGGKTTLTRDVLRVLRYGATRGLLAKDSVLLARQGSRGWRLEATLQKVEGVEAGVAISRTGAKCSVNAAGLDKAFGDRRVLNAVLEVDAFQAMTPDERRALVQDIQAVDMGPVLKKVIGEGAPEPIVQAVGEGDLRRAHRLAQEARREVAAKLKAAEALTARPAPPPVEVVRWKNADVPVSEIMLSDIQGVIRTIEDRISEAARGEAAAKAYDEALAAAERARGDLAAMASRGSWVAEDDGKLVRTTRDRQEWIQKQARVQAALEQAKAEREHLTALMERGGECPECGQAMEGARASVQAKLDALAERVRPLFEESRSIQGSLDAIERSLGEQQARKSAAMASMPRRLELEGALARAKALKPPPKVADVQALRDAQPRAQAILRARIAYEEGLRASAAQTPPAGLLDALRGEVAALEAVEAAVDPAAQQSGDALGAINTFCATYGPYLFGEATKEILPPVRVTEAWEIEVEGRPASLCSTSEQDRAGILLAAALASLSSLRLLVVDQLEHQDAGNRRNVLRLVKALTDEGRVDQAWLGLVPAEGRPPADKPFPEWLSPWWVEGGRVEALRPAPARPAAPASSPAPHA